MFAKAKIAKAKSLKRNLDKIPQNFHWTGLTPVGKVEFLKFSLLANKIPCKTKAKIKIIKIKNHKFRKKKQTIKC